MPNFAHSLSKAPFDKCGARILSAPGATRSLSIASGPSCLIDLSAAFISFTCLRDRAAFS